MKLHKQFITDTFVHTFLFKKIIQEREKINIENNEPFSAHFNSTEKAGKTKVPQIDLGLSTMWLWDFLLGFNLKAGLVFVSVILLEADFLKHRKLAKFPPGTLVLPFLGTLFCVDRKHSYKYSSKVGLQTSAAG